MGVQICTQQTRWPVKINPLSLGELRVKEKRSITYGLMFIKLKVNPCDWQHLLLGKHPNGIEFPMRADFYVTLMCVI